MIAVAAALAALLATSVFFRAAGAGTVLCLRRCGSRGGAVLARGSLRVRWSFALRRGLLRPHAASVREPGCISAPQRGRSVRLRLFRSRSGTRRPGLQRLHRRRNRARRDSYRRRHDDRRPVSGDHGPLRPHIPRERRGLQERLVESREAANSSGGRISKCREGPGQKIPALLLVYVYFTILHLRPGYRRGVYPHFKDAILRIPLSVVFSSKLPSAGS